MEADTSTICEEFNVKFVFDTERHMSGFKIKLLKVDMILKTNRYIRKTARRTSCKRTQDMEAYYFKNE